MSIACFFSLLLIPIGAVAFFHELLLGPVLHSEVLFYVRLASVFLCLVSLLLSGYYTNLTIRKRILDHLERFGHSLMNADPSKISKESVSNLIDSNIDGLRRYEIMESGLRGLAIPLYIFFVTNVIIMGIVNINTVLPLFFGCVFSTLLIKFFETISNIYDIRNQREEMAIITKTLINSSKGIQFYNVFDFMAGKLQDFNNLISKNIRISLSHKIWKSFFYISVAFIVVLLLFLIKKDYVGENLFNIKNLECIYTCSMASFTFATIILFRYIRSRNIFFADISRYQNQEEECNSDDQLKKFDRDNLFITFHGVYFQDPTKLSDFPILNNLGFSVLPGEFIVLTGDRLDACKYVFDLILKYYKPQSGRIYLSGAKIENIDKLTIRKAIGVFQEDFALIPGSIYENISMLNASHEKIINVCEKVDILDSIDDRVYDEEGNISISQDLMLRLQIARIAIQKPKVLLVTTPNNFESEKTEQMFYDFVEFSSRRKTTLIITRNPRLIVYSNKIIFINQDSTILFGPHAELSRNKAYQKFLKEL